MTDNLKILNDYANGDEFQRPVEWAVNEITELREKLAQLELALKVKDEKIKEITIYAALDTSTINGLAQLQMESLAIQPSQEALDEYVMSRLEEVILAATFSEALVLHRAINGDKQFTEDNLKDIRIGLQAVFNTAMSTPLYRLKDK